MKKLFLSVVFIIFLILALKLDFISDDSFISYRYGKNFAEGNGLVYNLGEKVEGYSNFSWVILNSLAINYNVNPLWFSRWFSLICSLIIFILMFYVSEKYFNVKFPFSMVAVILLAFNVGFLIWVLSGMETVFFTLLVLLSGFYVIRFISNGKKINLYLCSFSLLLCSLTRPEGILFVMVTYVFLVYYLIVSKEFNLARAISYILIPVLVFLVLYVLYFSWRYNYYGYIFPNTYYAKIGGGYKQEIRGLYYIYKFARESLGVGLLLILPCYFIYKNANDNKVKFLLVVICGYISYVIFIGGDGIGPQRFIVPVMPWMFLLIQSGLYELIKNLELKKFSAMAITLLVIFSSVSSTFDFRRLPATQFAFGRTSSNNLIKVSDYINRNFKKSERLAVITAGIVPFYTGMYSIDRLGLNDVHIAHKEMEGIGSGQAGHEKNDDDYVFQFKNPTLIIDAFPSSQKEIREDLYKFGKHYKFNSINIGEGEFISFYGVESKSNLYFNYYKLEE